MQSLKELSIVLFAIALSVPAFAAQKVIQCESEEIHIGAAGGLPGDTTASKVKLLTVLAIVRDYDNSRKVSFEIQYRVRTSEGETTSSSDRVYADQMNHSKVGAYFFLKTGLQELRVPKDSAEIDGSQLLLIDNANMDIAGQHIFLSCDSLL